MVNGIKSNIPESRDTSGKYKLIKSVVLKYVTNLCKYLKLCGKFLTENFIVAGKEGAKNNKVENRHTQLPGSLWWDSHSHILSFYLLAETNALFYKYTTSDRLQFSRIKGQMPIAKYETCT